MTDCTDSTGDGSAICGLQQFASQLDPLKCQPLHWAETGFDAKAPGECAGTDVCVRGETGQGERLAQFGQGPCSAVGDGTAGVGRQRSAYELSLATRMHGAYGLQSVGRRHNRLAPTSSTCDRAGPPRCG
jgi:hypothetical protein